MKTTTFKAAQGNYDAMEEPTPAPIRESEDCEITGCKPRAAYCVPCRRRCHHWETL